MKKLMSRIALVALGLTFATAASAGQVQFGSLKCAPVAKLGGTTATAVSCKPGAVVSGLVSVDQCVCPSGYVLVQANAPGAILKPVVTSPTSG